jgi:hypothetical protein
MGAFRSGRRNGYGTLRDAAGVVFQGKFVGGEAEGRGTRVSASGVVEEGIYTTPRKAAPATPGRTPRAAC